MRNSFMRTHWNHRAVFFPGLQRQLIDKVCERLRTSLKQLVDFYLTDSGVGYSGWKKFRREERLLPLKSVAILCDVGNLDQEDAWGTIQEIRNPNWGCVKGGRHGIRAVVEKYGERELQRRRLKGSNSRRFTEIAKLPKKPPICTKLAEFIGIHLGDGTMDKGFVRITGDVRYDLPYLSNYVLPLVNSLFGVQARLYTSGKNRLNLIASSTALCRYLNRRWGIPYGDKIRNGAHIPLCILKDRALFFACLRGLVDTDGSVSKDGDTISIRFDSHNPALMNSLIDGLGTHVPDLFTFSYSEEVGTHSIEKVKEYFRIVGSSNLKHVVRFSEWYLHDNLVYVRDVLGYFEFYENIDLPFILNENLSMNGPVV